MIFRGKMKTQLIFWQVSMLPFKSQSETKENRAHLQ